MLEDKELKIIRKEIERLIEQEKILIDKKNESRFTGFFVENSRKSFETAKLLLEISSNKSFQDLLGYP